METDWKAVLSFSQRELAEADKEKLCECLSWMEADDIELNFSDLKILFRLSQDILKYKSEQVNILKGEIEKSNRKANKTKHKASVVESPLATSESMLETITHQEDIITKNKKILEKLHTEIADLEERKMKHQARGLDIERDSDSSRDPLSEINATVQLEKEIFEKNRHIRKLLADVKILEEVNVDLKEKLSQLNNKLQEATQIIENLTEQLFTLNSERDQYKEALGECEQSKVHLLSEIEYLNKEMIAKNTNKDNKHIDVKSKLQNLKSLLKSHRNEVERLSEENTHLKEKLSLFSKPLQSPKEEKNRQEEIKIKELEDKLLEASNQIEDSANFIQMLKAENNRLNDVINEAPDLSINENKNESDDGKEKNIIIKLRKKLKIASANLQASEELVAIREKELADITTQLQLVQSEEGINTLLKGLKNTKRQLKSKDEIIKSLVIEVNNLTLHIDELQLENETLRQKLKVPPESKVPLIGTLKKYQNMEKTLLEIVKKLRKNENKLITIEMNNRQKSLQISKLISLINNLGYDSKKVNEILTEDTNNSVSDNVVTSSDKHQVVNLVSVNQDPQIQAIIEENEGLRVGLKEILEFLKDNSTTSSGVLALKSPSLENICHAMDARRMAGWFGSHMTVEMDLKAALGSKDALLTALHESRKETFNVMMQLSEECKKSSDLEQRLLEVKCNEINEKNTSDPISIENQNIYEFKYWIYDDKANNIDFKNKTTIQNMISELNLPHENNVKNCLQYFQNKFKALYGNLSELAITAEDNRNKWSIKEENYNVQIENLKSQLQQQIDEDSSIQSPGLISSPDVSALHRKISYLENLYKNIRILYENLKTEYMDSKEEIMYRTCDYETNLQNLLLCNINLSDKIHSCVPAALFWKQNDELNEFITKYRNSSEILLTTTMEKNDLLKRLHNDKLYILKSLGEEQVHTSKIEEVKREEYIEKHIYQKQLDQLTTELSKKQSQINLLNKRNEELQITSAKMIDSLMGSKVDKEEIFEQQIHKMRAENNFIKQENIRLQNQLDNSLLKLHENQQQKDNIDLEINSLRHQVLDLQAEGDNKAIVARLNNEILIYQLQLSENCKTIARLRQAVNKEKNMRANAEDMFKNTQKKFYDLVVSYEKKFRDMFEVLQVFRKEFQGSLPLCTIESFISNFEEIHRKTVAASEKLNEIEDLRLSLTIKHSVYNQILESTQTHCFQNGNTICGHNLQNGLTNELQKQELDLCNKKIEVLEEARKTISNRCYSLEQTLLFLSQGHDTNIKNNTESRINGRNKINIDKYTSSSSVEIDDILSEDEISTSSKRDQTFTLPKSKFVKLSQTEKEISIDNPDYNNQTEIYKANLISASTQTFINDGEKLTKIIQTEEDHRIKQLRDHINNLEINNKIKAEESAKLIENIQHLTQKVSISEEQKSSLESKVQNMRDLGNEKDDLIKSLQSNILTLRQERDNFKHNQYAQILQEKQSAIEENRTLLLTLKKIENEKVSLISEYKELLTKEREEFSKTVKDLHDKLHVVQTQLDGKEANASISNGEVIEEAISKYIKKITELDDKCFKLQSELNGSKSEIISYQSELVRWKDLAAERLSKMEQLGAQLKERHNVEVESYKAENKHWLSQLNDTQREHMELRSRLTEQKAHYIKQLADKETHIEQLRMVVQNLKTQIMNMQTMMSVNDPSFDLSAIVEVEEASEAVSPQGSERLELKFESVVDFQDYSDDCVKMPTTSTAIWQEPLIERLRREKQLISKQNAILRRQIKAIAARERRSRLDAQNLKNQVFRISTSGNKVATAESAALQNKIASLQAQLSSARRDAHSTVAIWDKWKRAQQTAEKWQVRYEEKCQVEKKLETSLNLTKSALSRLEKEKKVLLSRLSEFKNERCSTVEKQDDERSEKGLRSQSEMLSSPSPPVSTRALLDRVQAQQRRIAALEIAEKGNEPLVSEYEKALAEITSLKGQVLKLESTLLESQIRTPINPSVDAKPELEYWKSYCDMLKEENMQLTLRVNSLETTPTSAHQQRVNDLEQTVLTLRGLVSKLQADQKSGTMASVKRVDSRPGSGRSTNEKVRNQIDCYRMEISNLKRTIQEKDMLLERSKEMLKIAAEREDDLLKENMLLRRRFEELVERKGGFLSA